ncbi:MAG: glycine oxidase ThiO [Hamadaea sp.]|uniref:glycine oxidase ThiO n=1 Tax=Hamadaea sp. TaxID=2024425 RepID=UPI00185388EE|nr:glycine oxidase ThiO [Hamadaea sp.]NUR69861.1 glycine oxidase ThiO [Hamadaea sp.]NUT20106.1 glycine oxidase ThiO [Hamadaea sp.]
MRVAVVGAGPIGLACAWRLAQRDHAVTLHDDGAPGAWHAAAGMLAPVAEAAFGEHRLTDLLVASVRAWPAFAAQLGDVGFARSGSLLVGVTPADQAEIARYRSYQESLGLPVEALSADQLRQREPLLQPGVHAGAYTEIDAQVDPRRLVERLREACAKAGVAVAGAVHGLSDVDADVVVVAAGSGTAALTGLPIHPVRGEIVRLRGGPKLAHLIRGYVHGRHVYLVPRPNGEIVVGATSSEESDPRPTAGGVHELLSDAIALVPGVREAEFAEVSVGFRPATPDNLPIVDRVRRGLVVAAGHYRNGIALTPWTADRVVNLVEAQ